jgi:hypothetical protein
LKIIKFNTTVDINLLKEGLTNYEFYEEELKIPHNTVRGIKKVILAKYKIDINSRLAKHNINLINKSLIEDEENIDYILKHYFDNSLELSCPGLNYKHYLSYGLEYNTKMVDGKVIRKVKWSKDLEKAVTEYYISIWPDLFTNSIEPVFALVLEPVASYAGKLIFDYETINNYIPDFANRLLELRFAEVDDNGYEIDEELKSIIDNINGRGGDFMSKLYTFRVEFVIHFVRYAETVECVTAQQARKLIQDRYPDAIVQNVKEIK